MYIIIMNFGLNGKTVFHAPAARVTEY